MRILHLSSEYPPQKIYGLGRYVCGLSRELAAQGHEVHVLTNSMGGIDQDVIDDGVHIHRIDHPMPPKPEGTIPPVLVFNLFLQQRSFDLGLAGLGQPEVIVSHDYLTAPAGHRLARRWGLPHIWTAHDSIHGKRFGAVRDADDLAVKEIERLAAGEADLVLVNSNALRQEMLEHYGAPQGRIGLLPGGVNTTTFSALQSPARLAAFRECLAGNDEILVTYVGRLDPEKGIDTLINAFAEAKRMIPALKLAIAGSGDLQATILQHINQLHLNDSIQLPGYLQGEVLKHFYGISDIHVCPSHYEPFGLVALEAMAAGAAVIVSDTGGLTDIVGGKDHGIKVEPRNIGKLAEALIKLGSDRTRRKQLAQGARKRAEAFAWSEITRLAVAFYRKACNHNERKTRSGISHGQQ